MNKKYFQVVNSGNTGVGKINIYGDIGSWYEDINARDFLAAFNALEMNCNRINVHINSPGGSVWEGLPIANAIKASSVEIHTYVDGIAFSMGGIIALAAPKGNVHMAKGSLLMLHSASMYGYGNAKRLKKTAEDLAKYDDVLAGFVESRTGKSLDDVKAAYFDGEDHFFTPAEALAEGLIDVIEDYEATDTPEDVANMSWGEVAAWYQRKDKDEVKSENQDSMFNKYGKLSDLAKVAVNDRTDADFEAVNEQIQKAGVEGVTLVSDSYLSELESEKGNLVTDKTNLQTKVTDLEKSVSDKDARITALEKEVKDMGGKPAAAAAAVVTDKTDAPGTGEQGEVADEFETSVDRWAKQFV